MRVLLTGGSGFIGQHLQGLLRRQGHTIRLYDRQNLSTTDQLVDQEVLVHLAWSTVPKNATADPIADLETNVLGWLHLLEAARKNPTLKKVIFISSGGTVYGIPRQVPISETAPTFPISGYGLSKLTAEKYLHLYHHLYGLDYVILRVSNAYGIGQNLHKGQGVIGIWMQKALNHQPIEIWGDGKTIRDYVYVDDVCRAIGAAIVRHSPEKIFNVGSGRGYSLREVATMIGQVVGRPLEVRYKPGRQFDVPSNILSINRIEEYLQWKPEVSFVDGLQAIKENMRP